MGYMSNSPPPQFLELLAFKFPSIPAVPLPALLLRPHLKSINQPLLLADHTIHPILLIKLLMYLFSMLDQYGTNALNYEIT